MINQGEVKNNRSGLGLTSLPIESQGDRHLCVAILDGPVDQSHPCFDGANLTQLPTLVSGIADLGSASEHGTHVASIIGLSAQLNMLELAFMHNRLIVWAFAK